MAAQEPESSEHDRQREVRKYYQSWLDTHSLDEVPPRDDWRERPQTTPSPDTTLTAFAQLVALRLNVKRCLISLLDTEVQIVIAEATQSLSLTNQPGDASHDGLWLGVGSLLRADYLDEHVLDSTGAKLDAGGQKQELSALVINNTEEDDRFRRHPHTLTNPDVKFYAGVPITTKQGYQIGVCSISDTQAREQGLSVDQVQSMCDCAKLASEHLERLKHAVDRVRDEVFVRGMSSFIEGLSAYKHNLNDPQGDVHAIEDQGIDDAHATDPGRPTSKSEAENTNARKSMSKHKTDLPTEKDPEGTADEREPVPRYSKETSGPANENLHNTNNNIKQIFSRASHTIQETTQVKGCIFLDASSGINTLSTKKTHSRQSSRSPHARSDRNPFSDLDDEDEEQDVDQFMSTPYSIDGEEPNLLSPMRSRPGAEPKADILGASIAGHNAAPTPFLRRRTLHRWILRYPFGKVFHLENGEIATSQSQEWNTTVTGAGGANDHALAKQQTRSLPPSSSKLPKELLDQMVGAKWLVFLPLFNYTQDQWFAATFIWSDDNSVGDLECIMPYLKTFGSCVMSEVSSMEMLNTNIAKSTFIASMSHDLRSPLHGMLGSLEFLEDTMTSAYQMSLLGSIETCGKTLLDTLDHLLDFAKINDLNQAGMATNGTTKDGGAANEDSKNVSTFDIGLLLEEVVEAVFAGQTFRKSKLHSNDPVDDVISDIQDIRLRNPNRQNHKSNPPAQKFSGQVFVVLDIHQAKSYSMKSQTGALRRVIMNIVGNAIKYCRKGVIEIVLDSKDISSTLADVTIDVNDTGVGMSQYFLENHLFKAFSQENAFTSGAGLGLSIASQIVQNLNGKIRVKSEKGIGTHVSVKLPMEKGLDNGGESEHLLISAARFASGKEICLLNPMTEEHDMTKGRLSKLTASVTRTCEDWFHMTCSQARSVDECPNSSIYVYCEPPPIEYLLEQHTERKLVGKSGKEAALLIVCTNAFEAAALRAAGITHLNSLGRIVEVISQPVGSRKLAKVLLSSLQRVEALQTDATTPLGVEERTQKVISNDTRLQASDVKWNSTSMVYDSTAARYRPSIENYKWKSEQPLSRETFQTGQERFATLGEIKKGALPGGEPMPHLSTLEDADESAQSPYVLLVDDNAINLKLLVAFMKKVKLPYAEAVNGLEAFEIFRDSEKPFSLVLMDLQMPIMDGLESTRKIREHECNGGAPRKSTIIAITGVGSDATRKEAFAAGVQHYITKPVKFKALQELLERPDNSSSPNT